MLRFHADKFIGVFNHLALVESLLDSPDDLFGDPQTVAYMRQQVDGLVEQLRDLELKVSLKKATMVQRALKNIGVGKNSVLAQILKGYFKELRERIEDELDGRSIYYIATNTELLEAETPLFGSDVDDAFPSARYDIEEASKCLALRRSTACVMHLMRTLEIGLESLADNLGKNLSKQNWNTILNELETEIRARTRTTHGQSWVDTDEPFYTEAATHFRLVKNAWRNHAQHARAKYTGEEAEDIYHSVRAFMRHLSRRLREAGQESGEQSS
jgi:hypothetical protein